MMGFIDHVDCVWVVWSIGWGTSDGICLFQVEVDCEGERVYILYGKASSRVQYSQSTTLLPEG